MTQYEWDLSWAESCGRLEYWKTRMDEVHAQFPEPKDKKQREEVRQQRERRLRPMRAACVKEHNLKIKLNVFKQKGWVT